MIEATFAKQLQITRDGAGILKNCVPDDLLARLRESFREAHSNVRNALEIRAIREISADPIIRDLVMPVLGDGYFAVRAILFNKTGDANWKVAWHQDVVIAVKVCVQIEGLGPWSVKAGVPHVRPPAKILDNMLAVRIHLDDCGEDNGSLRILPGTHSQGVLSDSEITALPKNDEIVCSVDA